MPGHRASLRITRLPTSIVQRIPRRVGFFFRKIQAGGRTKHTIAQAIGSRGRRDVPEADVPECHRGRLDLGLPAGSDGRAEKQESRMKTSVIVFGVVDRALASSTRRQWRCWSQARNAVGLSTGEARRRVHPRPRQCLLIYAGCLTACAAWLLRP